MTRQFIKDKIRFYTKKEITTLVDSLFDYNENKKCYNCKYKEPDILKDSYYFCNNKSVGDDFYESMCNFGCTEWRDISEY